MSGVDTGRGGPTPRCTDPRDHRVPADEQMLSVAVASLRWLVIDISPSIQRLKSRGLAVMEDLVRG